MKLMLRVGEVVMKEHWRNGANHFHSLTGKSVIIRILVWSLTELAAAKVQLLLFVGNTSLDLRSSKKKFPTTWSARHKAPVSKTLILM